VAVARAVAYASKIIFMDEPTAALGVVQRERVLDNIKRVRDRGIAVVLISHNMPEVLAVADRVEVLRMGRRVARFRAADTNVEQLVGAMTGALTTEDDDPTATAGDNGADGNGASGNGATDNGRGAA
jgi:simple sugar transport system ATP-binding protein